MMNARIIAADDGYRELKILLARVEYVHDSDLINVNLVNQKIIWMGNGFTRSGYATSSVHERMHGQAFSTGLNLVAQAICSRGISLSDVSDNCPKIFAGHRVPDELQH